MFVCVPVSVVSYGSVGSFFDFRPTEGAYEANPPFVRDVILKMANHMDSLLEVRVYSAAVPDPTTAH